MSVAKVQPCFFLPDSGPTLLLLLVPRSPFLPRSREGRGTHGQALPSLPRAPGVSAARARGQGWRVDGRSFATAMRTNQLIKYTLFVSCYLFWVASGVMVAVGIYARLAKEAGAMDSLLSDPSTILLAVGILVFAVTFVGCLGALRDITLMLKMFAWILLIIVILQVVAAVLGFLFSGMVMEKASLLMGQAISRYRDNLDLQNLIDYIQKKFQCCGVHTYKDWSQNMYFNCQDSNPSLERCAVPFSCCVQGGEPILNTMCGYGTQNMKAWRAESRVHTLGCLEKTVRWGRSNLLLVSGLAFGLLVLEVVIFFLALVLIYQIQFIIQKRRSTRRGRQGSHLETLPRRDGARSHRGSRLSPASTAIPAQGCM